MAAELKAIREAKKIFVTKLKGRQAIYNFERNPTTQGHPPLRTT